MEDPIIPIPLSKLLPILWGYRDRTDRRDKAVPGKDITDLLAAVPAEIAAQHFHIQDTGPDSLPIVWQIDEWKRSGHREHELRVMCNKTNFKEDKLTEWLIANVPFWKTQDKSLVRNFVFMLVRDNAYDSLKPFGLSDDMISHIREGTY